MKNKVVAVKTFYKGTPLLLTVVFLIGIYKGVLSDTQREDLKTIYFEYFKGYRNENVIDLFMIVFAYCIVLIITIAILVGLYFLFRFIWYFILDLLGVVKTNETTHISKVINKYSEEESMTTYIDSGGTNVPVTSYYENFYIVFKVGNKDYQTFEESVSESLYSKLKVDSKYKIDLVLENIFGVTVNHYLDLDSIEKY